MAVIEYNTGMPLRRDRKLFFGIILLIVLLNTIPFWLAARAGEDDFVFSGLLLNPMDGHTYLAKLYQGWRGDWRFALPYTPNPGQGAYIFLFYLFLGHFARLTQFSLSFTFSLFRILGGVCLLYALYRFFAATVHEDRPRRVAFTLASLGSGMGWLLLPANQFTSDFWVAEAYPFLSIYDNPHFPFGLALIAWLLTPTLAEVGNAPQKPAQGWQNVIFALALGILSPFGVVVVTVVLAGWAAGRGYRQFSARGWRGFIWQPATYHLVSVMLGGVPVLLYQFFAIRADPVLSGWDAQNVTLTPPWWDVLVSFSPALFFALAGARSALRQNDHAAEQMVVWAVIGLVLIAIPFGLQRRFMMGLYIPFAGLAALGVEALAGGKRSRARIWITALFLLALPTNLIVLLAGQQGARTHDLLLYITRTEASAMEWLEANTTPDALVLASPSTGLMIPAYTGRQVIYGHPFETVNAEIEEQALLDFFQTFTEPQAREFLLTREVDYLFYGPRERVLGELPVSGVQLVYEQGDVQIFAVNR